jgi:ketosteroid isomerase-like protein
MKKLVAMITLGALCMLALSPVGVSAQTTDPVAVVDAFRAALGNDVEAALALVADDAVVSIVPPPPNTSGMWAGKEQIRQYLDRSVTFNAVHERKGDARVEGDKVTMTVMVLNNDFRQWGIGAVEHTYDAVVQGGKIKSITITMAEAERDRVRAAAQAYNLVAVVDAFLAALQNNAAAGLALVADDAVVRVVPPPPNTPNGTWSGKEQLRQYMDFSVMQDSTIERIGSAEVEGDKVTMTVMVLVNDFRQWGIGAVEHTVEAVVQGGKIKYFTFIMAPSERGRVAAAAQAYVAAHPPAGMPRTGGELPVPLLVLVVMGVLAALGGLGLRRTIKSNIQ